MKQDKILVPVDGSESAERSFDKAVKIAMTENAHVDVLNVIDTRQFLGEMQDTLITGDTVYQMTHAVERMLMGSVTEYVNQHALADVLIVRTDVDNKPLK